MTRIPTEIDVTRITEQDVRLQSNPGVPGPVGVDCAVSAAFQTHSWFCLTAKCETGQDLHRFLACFQSHWREIVSIGGVAGHLGFVDIHSLTRCKGSG